jgi:hypothetical protein
MALLFPLCGTHRTSAVTTEGGAVNGAAYSIARSGHLKSRKVGTPRKSVNALCSIDIARQATAPGACPKASLPVRPSQHHHQFAGRERCAAAELPSP